MDRIARKALERFPCLNLASGINRPTKSLQARFPARCEPRETISGMSDSAIRHACSYIPTKLEVTMTDSSREAGYAGAQQAADHADRVIPTWSKLGKVMFLRFLLASGRGTCFVTSDAARWCIANGLPKPPDDRAMGNLVREAARKNLIRDTGRRPRAGSHSREVVEWAVA